MQVSVPATKCTAECLRARARRPTLRLILCQAPTVSLDLELLDQSAKSRGRLHQLLRRLLGVSGAARSAFGSLRYARNVTGDLAAAMRRFAHVAAISLVVAVCSSTALAIVLEMSLIWLMTSPI